jgi:signal transduction histidine kinase
MRPSAAVVVATVRALKYHGGVEVRDVEREDLGALERGLPNLVRHLDNLRAFGLPCVVAINHRAHDTAAEIALLGADPAAAREALADCVEESERVLALLNALLDVTEAEAGLMRLDRRPTDLARLATELADAYSMTAEEKSIAITVATPEPVEVDVDPVRMRQVIANLLDNAVKYTPQGGKVGLAVTRDGTAAVIRVWDNGPGVPEEEQDKVWTRLYRGDRSRGQRGLGLGLSVVKAVVEAHRGTVSVQANPGGGALFVVRVG